MSNKNALLGGWKSSSLWYTPSDIWTRIEKTFDSNRIFDPCPIEPLKNGLELNWSQESKEFNGFIYCNPPISSSLWAKKTLLEFESDPLLNIIHACYSMDVLNQVPKLNFYPRVMVRNRISWINGKSLEKGNSPRNYNAFILLSSKKSVLNRFKESFHDLGSLQKSVPI